MLGQLLAREHTVAMGAVETTISLQMARGMAVGGLNKPALKAELKAERGMEAEAEAANWKVLSMVLYPSEGPHAFKAMKRQQWRDEQYTAIPHRTDGLAACPL